MEQRIQEVVHDRVVGNPTQTTELIVKVLILLEQGRPLRGIGDSGNANLGEVTDDGLHDLLVTAVLVVGQGHANATIPVSASGSNLVEVLVSLVDIVGAELPCALLVAIDARRNNAVGRSTGTLKMVLQMASRLMAREIPLRRSALLNGSAVVLQVR